MKKHIMALLLGLSFIGCAGKDGTDGTGTRSRVYEGTITSSVVTSFSIGHYEPQYSVTAYYSTIESYDRLLELSGPINDSDTNPYYELQESNTGIAIVYICNVPVGYTYRVVVHETTVASRSNQSLLNSRLLD